MKCLILEGVSEKGLRGLSRDLDGLGGEEEIRQLRNERDKQMSVTHIHLSRRLPLSARDFDIIFFVYIGPMGYTI